MRKTNQPLFLFVLSITVLLLGFMGVSRVFAQNGKETPAEAVTNFLFRPVQSLFSGAEQSMRRFFENISSAESFHAENEQLKAEIEALKKEQRKAISVRKENERLRTLLALQKEAPEYDMIACEVIARAEKGGKATFQVNKGINHGIRVGDAVVVQLGLVGKVTAVSADYATVTPIETLGSAVGARIVRTQAFCVAEGTGADIQLTFLTEETAPQKGDEVETSGVGGVYPQGFLLGTVRDVRRESGTFVAELDKKVDSAQIYEVMVIRGYSKKQE